MTTTAPTTNGSNGHRRTLPTPQEVAERTSHYPDDVRDAIAKFHRIIVDENWSLVEAGKHVIHGKQNQPLSSAVLSQLLSGQYPSPSNVAQSIQRAVNLHQQRRLMEETGFVETRLTKAVFHYCDFASHNQRIVPIYGRTHDGKTTALQGWKNLCKHGQPIYVRLPASASYLVAAKSIARALGQPNPRGNEDVRDAVLGTVSDAHTLLIDEAHLPFTTYQRGHGRRLLEFIREIYDVCQCGIVFCGTQTLRHNLIEGDDALLFRQLIERSPTVLDTTNNKPSDMRPGHGPGGRKDFVNIAASFGLPEPDPDSEELAKRIVSTHSTGRLFHLLSGARNRAKAAGEAITWDHFQRTYDSLERYNQAGQ